MIHYELPSSWIRYDGNALLKELSLAKAAVMSLTSIPYQKAWAQQLQNIQLKREIEGTSRIEGAEFSKSELDAALKETADELFTRSQKQARAALRAYKWIAELPKDLAVNKDLILAVHRLIVIGADDDHCPPGKIRTEGQNVNFGSPKHRGADGGEQCATAFDALAHAVQRQFKDHDELIQALALHYHLAAIHPFLDGNGRTARALEALILQRAGLKGELFIAMSNYYYEQKLEYLAALAQVRASGHDLTEFLRFGLVGISSQCRRLFVAIRKHVSKALFRNIMHDLFGRMQTKRKRVIAKRQIQILELLLESDEMDFQQIIQRTNSLYASLQNPFDALVRDLNHLIELRTITYTRSGEDRIIFTVRLEWGTEITETDFFDKLRQLPRAKTHPFL